MLAEAARPDDEDVFEIWPENMDIVMAFLDHSQRWRRSFLEMSGQVIYEGLRWNDVLALLREDIPGRRRRLAIVDGMQIMERAALPLLNNRG